MKVRAGIKYVGPSTVTLDIPSCAYAPDHSEIDQGAAGKGRSIKAYVDKIGSENGSILLTNKAGQDTTTYTLTTSETIPSTVTLRIEPGAILAGAGTLTINGPFEHGLSQCFGSSITVVGLKETRPDWWATNTTPGTTVMSVALQKAVTSAVTTDGDVLIHGKNYLLYATNIDRAMDSTERTMYFRGEAGAEFCITTAIAMFSTSIAYTDVPVSENVEFQNIKFSIDDGNINGYVLDNNKISQVVFVHCYFAGIRCVLATTYFQTLHFIGCFIKHWHYTNFFVRINDEAYDILFLGNRIEAGGGLLRVVDTTSHVQVAGVRIIGNLIEGLTGPVLEGGNFRGLSITGNYFEANCTDTGTFNNAIGLNVDSYNYGVEISGNFFSVDITNAADAAYWEVDIGGTYGFNSGGNYCSARLYNNDLTTDIDTSNDYAVTAKSKSPLTERLVSSTFTGTLTGCTTSPTGTIKYERHKNTVTLYIPGITATSNSTACTITGMPAGLYPTLQLVIPITITDNGADEIGAILVNTDGVLYFLKDMSLTGFTNSGTKGSRISSISYVIS